MALPVTISGTVTAERQSYHGPFRNLAGTVFYTILLDSTNRNLVTSQKSFSPDVSWAPRDTNRPDFIVNVASLTVFQDGDLLHIVGQNDSDDLYYSRFDMSGSGAWVDLDPGAPFDTDILVDGAPDGFRDACDICVLSTGKIRIVYQGETDMVMGTNYERIDHAHSTDGFSWTAAVAVNANNDEKDYRGPQIVLPPSNGDQAHIFYSDGTNLLQRAINSSDVLRTERDTGFDVTADLYPIGQGVGFLRSSTSKVRVPYREVTTNDLEILRFDAFLNDSTPTWNSDNISGDDVRSFLGAINACLAVDGSTVHVLFVNATDKDLYSADDGDSDTWTTPLSSFIGTVVGISCNVYDRSGTKLAHIIDDGGTVKYDEDALAAASITVTTSLEAAVENQLSLAASLNAGLLTERQLTSTADGAIASFNIATASLEAAVTAAVTAEANLQAAVKATVEKQSVLDAAMSRDFAGASELDAVLGTQGLVSAGVGAALRAAQVATASLTAALQAEATSETGLTAGLSLMQARQTALQAVIASLEIGQASIDAAIERGQSSNSVLDGVVQAAISVGASLDGVIGTAQALVISLDAVLAAARDATVSMDVAVAGARFASGSADAALIRLVAVATSVDAALAMARSAVTSLDTAIAQGGSAATSLDAANQVLLAFSVGADAAVESAVTRSASLAAALQRALSNVASLDAQLVSAGQIIAALDGVLQLASLVVAAGVDAALLGVPALSAALDAVLGQIVGSSTARTFALPGRQLPSIGPGGRVIIIPPGDRVH